MKPSILDFYFSSEGRVSSWQFWSGLVLPCCGVLFLAMALAPPNAEGGFLANVVAAAICIVPAMYVGVKRLHDMGFSGWFLLIGFTPYVGPFLLFAWMGFGPDGVGDNKYGPSPK